MKKFSKLFALLLAFALVLGSMTTVFAGNAMDPLVTAPNMTGKVTISNALAGATYKLYRVLDISGTTADGSKSSFVTNTKWNTIIRGLGNKWCTVEGTGAGGLVTPVADLTQTDTAQQFAAKVLADANGTIDPDKTATVETSGTYDLGSLPYGYYVMVSSRQSAEVRYTVFTLNKNELTITEKNVKTPTIDKKVKNAEAESDAYADAISADYNAVLNYSITITAVAGTDTYTITDVLPESITLVENKLAVSKVSGNVTTPLVVTTDYTVTSTTTSFTITLTDALRKGLKDGDKIVLTYNATLKAGSATLTPKQNTATLYYSVDQKSSDSATVYTGHISFYKVDGKSKAHLAGAKFVLKSKTGKYAVLTKADNNNYNYSFSHAVDTQDEATVITTFDTTDAYTIRGLSAGEYTLIEIEAPENYIKGEDTTITISEKRNGDGLLEGLETPTSVTIVNMPGSTLPETGGTGTTIFYIAGAVLVVAALALLLIKRRASSEN